MKRDCVRSLLYKLLNLLKAKGLNVPKTVTFNSTDYYKGIKLLGKALADHKVDYLFVGGVAIAFYGKARPSVGLQKDVLYDIDIWYKATTTNFYNLSQAILKLNPELKESLDNVVFDPNRTFIKFNRDNFHFDFLTGLKAFNYKDFDKCFKAKEIAEIDGIELIMISKKDLIRDKESLGREKDLADIENLKEKSYKGFSK